MSFLAKTFYRLTAYLPRPLPRTFGEYRKFKRVLQFAYGVPDNERAWITVAGYITSTPATKMYRPWVEFANAAKRLDVNDIAQDDKKTHLNALNAKVCDLMEKESARMQAEEKANGNKEAEIIAETYVDAKQEAPEINASEAKAASVH